MSEMAANFSQFVMHLVTCRVPSALAKSRTRPLTFFFFFLLAQISNPLPLPRHLRWSKLGLTNSINILTVIHLGDEEAAAGFCSLQALPIPEELRVISR